MMLSVDNENYASGMIIMMMINKYSNNIDCYNHNDVVS